MFMCIRARNHIPCDRFPDNQRRRTILYLIYLGTTYMRYNIVYQRILYAAMLFFYLFSLMSFFPYPPLSGVFFSAD